MRGHYITFRFINGDCYDVYVDKLPEFRTMPGEDKVRMIGTTLVNFAKVVAYTEHYNPKTYSQEIVDRLIKGAKNIDWQLSYDKDNYHADWSFNEKLLRVKVYNTNVNISGMWLSDIYEEAQELKHTIDNLLLRKLIEG